MPVKISLTAISFLVMVPVLSRHRVCTAPRVSTACRWRISTWCRRMSRIPRARVVVAAAGSPSGTAAAAKQTAVRSISSQPYPQKIPRPKAAPQRPKQTHTSRLPNWSSCRWSGVSGASASPVRDWISPISVKLPMATTTISPSPPVTRVPMNPRFTRSPRGIFSPRRALTDLTTGRLSPVSADSSRERWEASTMRPSAGT